ncbi:MAG: site-2 protease family protein [Pyrinomonadaceae bacterium]
MNAQIRLGKIFGIEIGLHYSWLIIAFLIVFSLSQYFSESHPGWSGTTIWTMSILTAILFFSAIVVHELSHAAVAKRSDLPVKAITLFALGGVAQIENEPASPKTEFWLGIIGPLTSAFIGLACFAAAMLLGWPPMTEPQTPPLAVLVWLAYVNFALAIFNMIPGYPMDGGRVLRAVIWGISGSADTATRAAARAGQGLAFGFIFLGIYLFFSGSGFGGLWLAFIGWFLLSAAKASYLQVEFSQSLRDVTAGDLMLTHCAVLDANTSLQSVIEDHILKSGQRCFMVAENGRPVGLITPNEIAAVERRLWPFKTASDAMRPLESLFVVGPETPAIEALEIIGRENVNQLPVVKDGRLLGILSRDNLINYLTTRKELNL